VVSLSMIDAERQPPVIPVCTILAEPSFVLFKGTRCHLCLRQIFA